MSFVKNGVTYKDHQEYILALEQQLAAAEAKNARTVYFRVSEDKGTIGMYGFNTKGMPVSLYAEQWPKAFEAITGKPLDPASPLGEFLKKAEKFVSLKAEKGTQTEKDKRILRLADTTGVVSHPSNKTNNATK